MDQHYYIFSGLGADERVFANVVLPENHTHLHWIENRPNETLHSYAARMALGITHKNPILIGLSFGGIVAQEIASQKKIEKLILISTVTSRAELPWHFRLADHIKLVNWVPDALFTSPNRLVAFAFSLTRKQDKTILYSCFEIMSIHHLKWASNAILHWRGIHYDCPKTLINCKQDRIFTANRKSGDLTITGGHFAIFTNPIEMQRALNKALA